MFRFVKIYVYVFFVMTSVLGCKHTENKESNFSRLFESDYELWKKEFPDSLTRHFPKKLNQDLISYGSSYRNKPKKFLYLSVFKKLTLNEKLKFSKMQSIQDTCIIQIYSNKVYYGFDKSRLGNCNYYPVPDYKLIHSKGQKPNDLQYYILELSHKKFINNDLYLRYYLPDEWKNGMSRGVGISENENTIFYWLIMW